MPQFDSGAAEPIGRFTEGLLLRLLHLPNPASSQAHVAQGRGRAPRFGGGIAGLSRDRGASAKLSRHSPTKGLATARAPGILAGDSSAYRRGFMLITHRLFTVAFQQNMRALEKRHRDARRAREIVRSGVADYAGRCRGAGDCVDSGAARKESADVGGEALAGCSDASVTQ